MNEGNTVTAPTDEQVQHQGITEQEFHERLEELVREWQGHHGADLAIRFKTGKLLNDMFGPPSKRQKRGDQVLKKAAERLQLDVSEISRLRRFAHSFSSVEDWLQQNPKATTWTAVKDLLSKLKSRDQAGQISTNARSHSAGMTGVQQISKSLATLSGLLHSVHTDLAKEDREELLEKFQEVVKALEACLHVKVEVSEVSAETALPAAPKDFNGSVEAPKG